MNLTNKLEILADAFASIDNLKVYHYWRPQLQAPYAIWQEDSEWSSLNSDNHKSEQSIGGTIDYFTLEEFDSMCDAIQEKLNSIENLRWSLNSVQYEEDTNLIHYEWEFNLL